MVIMRLQGAFGSRAASPVSSQMVFTSDTMLLYSDLSACINCRCFSCAWSLLDFFSSVLTPLRITVHQNSNPNEHQLLLFARYFKLFFRHTHSHTLIWFFFCISIVVIKLAASTAKSIKQQSCLSPSICLHL